MERLGQFQVRTSLTLEEEFSDNVDQRADDRKSEFRTSIAPGVAAHLEVSRFSLDLNYALRFFVRDGRLKDATLDDAADSTLSSRWKLDVTPTLQLSMAEAFTKTTDFLELDDPGTRRTGTASLIRNRASAELAYVPPPHRAALSYTNLLVRSDAPDADRNDTHIVGTDIGLAGPLLNLGGSYTLTRGEFDIASPYWEHGVLGRIARTLTPTTTATLSFRFNQHDAERGQDFMIGGGRLGGALALSPDASLAVDGGAEVFAPRDSTATVSATASLAWTQRFALFSVTGRYEEGFRERFLEVDVTGVARTRSGTFRVTSTAFRDLTATLGATWTENRFEQTTVAGGPAGTRDRTWNLEAGIRYLILRSLVFTLGYVAVLRTSTVPSAEFLENRVRLGLAFQYDLF
jgi:hypothetical protein